MSSSASSPPFKPVRILDLQLDEAGRAAASLESGTPLFVVFWSGERPVGQLSIGAEEAPKAAITAWLADFVSPACPAPLAPPPESVSLVICTRDRPDELARCLASLPSQVRRPDEVIVVDNASRDHRSRDVARAAGVRYLREDRPGLDIARNTGALAARSRIIAYTDDDTELEPNWLAALVAAFDRDDIMAVTGLVLPAELETRAQWLFETDWSFGRGFERVDFDHDFYRRTRDYGCPAWLVGAGANMAFRRECFVRVGLFDERLDVGAAGCSGDSEYWHRVLWAGYTCRYEPAAVLRHYHRATLQGLESQIYHYMRGHVAALMVQYERTGDRGNLRRAFVTLPGYFATLALARWRPSSRSRGVPGSQATTLGRQVAGSIAGLIYYARHRGKRA